jgi:HSP20 family molecular chaperone IbpA
VQIKKKDVPGVLPKGGATVFGLIPRKRAARELARRDGEPLALMRREFAALFDRFFGAWPLLAEPLEEKPYWGFEIEETVKEAVIRAEVPGFEVGDLKLEVAGDTLMILAEHKKEVKEKEAEERYLGRLERTVLLPPDVEVEKIEAVYRNGILEIHIPKKPDAVPRRIEVKT